MTAEEIAAGLSAEQRYLLKLAATNHHVVTLNKKIYHGVTTRLLIPYDNGNPETHAFIISPLGQQVRAILESNHDRT